MLEELGFRPSGLRELRAVVIGRTLGMLCHMAGRLLPMYGAGKLESRNIREYELAARFAARSGHAEYVECLLTMAEVEWEHEKYFRGSVESHRWSSRIRMWPRPDPKETIRAKFKRECGHSREGIEGGEEDLVYESGGV
jgi:hypothetical protein